MAVSFVAVSNAAGHSNGTTTTANAAGLTINLPAGTASGDRVFVYQSHNCATGSAATPTGWTALYKDQVVGTGAPAAAAGQRFISCYYRDYDGVWTMPIFQLASAVQNTHWGVACTLRKGAGETWGTPTASGVATDFADTTTTFSCTTAAFSVVAGGFLMANCVTNDNVTATTPAITFSPVNGGVMGSTTERADGGNATGNDVSGKLITATVTTAPSPATGINLLMTTSAATQGGGIVTQQLALTPKLGTASAKYHWSTRTSALRSRQTVWTTKANTTSPSTTEDTGQTGLIYTAGMKVLDGQLTCDPFTGPTFLYRDFSGTEKLTNIGCSVVFRNPGAGSTGNGTVTLLVTNLAHADQNLATFRVAAHLAVNPIGWELQKAYNNGAGALVWTVLGSGTFGSILAYDNVTRHRIDLFRVGNTWHIYLPDGTKTSITDADADAWSGPHGTHEISGSASTDMVPGFLETWADTTATSTTPQGNASATWAEAGTATGKEAAKGSVSATLTWGTSTTGKEPAKGAVSTTWSEATSAAGKEPAKGSVTSTWVEAGAATGKEPAKGTASTTAAWAVAATGKEPAKGSAAAAWVEAGTAVGREPAQGSASTTWAESAVATGATPAVAPKQGSAAATLAWGTAATGSRLARGTAPATWAMGAVAAGREITRGAATATWAEAGTATGREITSGSAAGLLSWTADASGREPARGSVQATLNWSATPEGRTHERGSAAATLSWSASSAGRTDRSGTASATLAWGQTAAGRRSAAGAATGAYNQTGQAAGTVVRAAGAAESHTLGGAAVGVAPVPGQQTGFAAATLSWGTAASGRKVTRGSTSPTWTEAGTATGKTTRGGSAAATERWTGSPLATSPRQGGAGASLSWSAATEGRVIHRGSATAALAVTATATGHTPLITGGREGNATATLRWLGAASGPSYTTPARSWQRVPRSRPTGSLTLRAWAALQRALTHGTE